MQRQKGGKILDAITVKILTCVLVDLSFLSSLLPSFPFFFFLSLSFFCSKFSELLNTRFPGSNIWSLEINWFNLSTGLCKDEIK